MHHLNELSTRSELQICTTLLKSEQNRKRSPRLSAGLLSCPSDQVPMLPPGPLGTNVNFDEQGAMPARRE